MRVVYRLEELPLDSERVVATVGNFDGVHLGHQRVVRELVERARKIEGTTTVVTFHPHPLQVLAPNNAPRQIQTLNQKLRMMAGLGVDVVVVIPFTKELAQTRARDFAIGILKEKISIHEVYVGPNFAFGHRREGSLNLLREIGEAEGFVVGRIPQVQFRGNRVSSTAIRQALVAGQAGLARRLLGRPYALEGEIARGAEVGKTLRVPTANLDTRNALMPRHGVYVSFLRVEGVTYRGVTNIGVKPTITPPGEDPKVSVETHILDFEGDLYGYEVELELLCYLRPERRFPDVPALVAQIQIDVGRARRFHDWCEKSGSR